LVRPSAAEKARARPVTDPREPIDITRYLRVPKAHGKLWQVINGQIVADLHAGQSAAWDSTAQIVAIISGAQSGKTSFGPLWLRREIALRGPGDYLAVSSNFRLQRLKMEPETIRLFDKTLHLGTWHKGDHYYELDPARAARQFDNPDFATEPTRILFGSAQNPESLESVTAKAAWLDEVGQRQFRLESWEAVQRRVALHMGRELLTTTPYNLGFLKTEVYDKWIAGDPRFQVIQFASHINPAFPRAAMRAAKAALPRWRYLLFYLGRFTKPAGLIYSDFVDEYRERGGHLVHPFEIPSRWPRYVGIDFGGANTALVWWAHDPDRDIFYAYRESLSGNKSTREHAAEFWQNASGENVVGICGGSASETQQRMDWTTEGVPVEEPAFSDVEAGIDRVTELIKKKRLFVFDTLAGLRSEYGSYSRKLDRLTGQPNDQIEDKARYHRLDGVRYVSIYVTEMLNGSGLGLTLAGGARSGWHDVA
jgi:hypothetical protein